MKSKKRIKIGEREKEIIKILGTGVIILSSLAIPNLPIVLAPFIENKTKRANTKKLIRRLEEKDVIYLSGEKIKLAKKARNCSGDWTQKKL